MHVHHMHANALGGQWTFYAIEELDSCEIPNVDTGDEAGSSEGAARVLKHRAISPVSER